MAYKAKNNSGFAERQSYMEIDGGVTAITGEEATDLTLSNVETAEDRRYAQLVYIAGGDISGSGGVASNVTIDNDSLITDPSPYGVVIEATLDGNITWVAEAVAGTSRATAAWRVKRITKTKGATFETTEIQWAGDPTLFNQVATAPLSGLSYS